MGTRSIIAVPQGDAWKGRFCHWDGYPTAKGPALFAIVARDGLELAQQTLTEDHPSWSVIDTSYPTNFRRGKVVKDAQGQPLTIGGKPYKMGDEREMYGDGRFAPVKGYGIAHTTEPHPLYNMEHGQANQDDWIEADGDKWGTEWLYVLSPGGLLVGKVGFDDSVTMLGLYPWDAEPDWEAVEASGYPAEDEVKV